jgi:hypothetical protein
MQPFMRCGRVAIGILPGKTDSNGSPCVLNEFNNGTRDEGAVVYVDQRASVLLHLKLATSSIETPFHNMGSIIAGENV